MMEEVNIKESTTLDTKVVAPISIEDPGATTKDIHAKTGAFRSPMEAKVAIVMPIRRSINPHAMTVSSSMPISTYEVISRIAGPCGMR